MHMVSDKEPEQSRIGDREQFFYSENSAKNLGTVAIGPVARNHTSSNMARNFIATHQIMYYSSYLVHQRVPLLIHFSYTFIAGH